MKILKLTFTDKSNNTHTLNYKIYPSSLSDQWISLVRLYQQTQGSKLITKFSNKSYEDLWEVTENLRSTIYGINTLYDQKIEVFNQLDTEKLNLLHEKYEHYGNRKPELEKNKKWSRPLDENFLKLNDFIHLAEDILRSKNSQWANFALLFNYVPVKINDEIVEEHMENLRVGLEWGKLYLGYNTLGKDWLKIWCDNDLEVIERNQVKPQKYLSAETWLNFGMDENNETRKFEFKKWYDTLSPSLQKEVPIDSPNELILGRFLIGELIIDETFLSIHPNIEDWYLPNHQCKNQWNKQIFAKINKLVNIEILELS